MANVVSSFTSLNEADSAFNALASSSTSTAISNLSASLNSNVSVSSYSIQTSAKIVANLTNGDTTTLYGSNLLSYPATITRLDYNSVAQKVYLSALGNVSIANGSSSAVGNLNHIELVDSSGNYSITYKMNGTFHVSSTTPDALTDVKIETNGTSILIAGSLYEDSQSPAGISGTITSVSFASGSHSTTLTNLNMAYSTFNAFANFHDFLSTALNGDDTISGTASDELLMGYSGNDTLMAYSGNDTLTGGLGNDTLDGGAGTDTAVFNINKSAITEMHHLKSGGVVITSSEGVDTLTNIESFSFLDGTLTAGTSGDIIKDFITSKPLPSFSSIDANGVYSNVSPTLYTGPVAFLEYQLLGNTTGDVIVGSSGNDFMNLLGGDDAANGGAGDDVLDGGTGSNFLSGGGGNDTLFLDGRNGTPTWSTVTDFNAGDQVNIWGWRAGTSKLLLTEANGGANGYTGATFHYDLDNNGSIDTSITFTGLSVAQIPTGVAMSVAGNGYLLVG